MPLQVIGAGFGRTGTLSLKAALERLGLSKCHHMTEVMAKPKTAAIWLAASRGEAVDWGAAMEGCQAAVDWPSCTYYKELMAAFPEAKVLLSVRDPERWYESVRTTIFELSVRSPRWLAWIAPPFRAVLSVSKACVWSTFDGRFEDRDHAIAVFKDHIAEVKRVVPADRLLVFEVAQGWGPLCEFLGVPVPDEPFPHLNDRAVMMKRVRAVQIARWVGPLLLLALVAGLVGWILGMLGASGLSVAV